MRVAVIGASNKTHRYAYQAVKLLAEHGHTVYPIHPRLRDIDGIPVYPSIRDIPEAIDTVTLYVGEAISTAMTTDILGCRPRRIIFNPGAENPGLYEHARKEEIEVLSGCTLVMLKTHQF